MTNRQPVTEAPHFVIATQAFLEAYRAGGTIDECEQAVAAAGYRIVPAQASQLSEPRTAELVEALRNLVLWCEPLCQRAREHGVHGRTCPVEIAARALAATDATAPGAGKAHGPDCGCRDCMLNAQAEDATAPDAEREE